MTAAQAVAPAAPPTVPVPYRVVDSHPETADTVTFVLEPAGDPLPRFRPGQFAMLYAFGIGEVPISVSGIHPDGRRLTHTVRAVGAVSSALCALRPGDRVGVRGPFGESWDLPVARGGDVLVIAGGIGLAPLRPLLREALADSEHYRRVSVLIGARSPDELLYREELGSLDGTRIAITVDRPDEQWRGEVGMVTGLLHRAAFDPGQTTAFVCGPEVMIRATARELHRAGLHDHRIRVSLERNMRCGNGHCGHCQLGPVLLCLDGPVLGYDRAGPLLAVREL